MDDLNMKRGKIFNTYCKELKILEDKGILTLPKIPSYSMPNYHLFHIILKSEEKRNSLMNYLREKQIGATFHYVPLHIAPAGAKLGYKKGDFPLTEDYASRLLRLPLYPDLTESQQKRIIQEISAWNS